ncbi:MAG TPA: Hsp20/alpha crystallin family protein [Thermoanaerobaculia bacterium]|nr:Hsp20/alpha crystallin family protein [Thermoanaerobaculia bacterium]HUM30959.1 Hsp20/alpha crystallin family protein [Thermoanaerobaculia bacterium]HXK69381.1 Hsp20/alpha crystallin family protein [Thermoanaerobaculia bacterium]
MAPARTRLEEILIIRSELNRLLEELHLPVLDQPGLWSPPMDCSEDCHNYYLTVEIPGATLSTVELNIQGKTLSVEGNRQPPEGSSAEAFQRLERFYGPFKRSITLSHPVDSDRVDAKLEHGILSITVPKRLRRSQGD